MCPRDAANDQHETQSGWEGGKQGGSQMHDREYFYTETQSTQIVGAVLHECVTDSASDRRYTTPPAAEQR